MRTQNFLSIFLLGLSLPAAWGHAVYRGRAVPGECTFTAEPQNGDTCESFADWWGITVSNLLAFNPSLSCPTGDTSIPIQEWCVEMILPPKTTTTTSGPTTTSTSAPTPTQENVIKTCSAWYKVVKGDTCLKIVDKYKTFSLSQFSEWNPDVGADCSGLPLDFYVCVGVPGTTTGVPTTTGGASQPTPTQENVTKECKAWYKVVSGDYCQKIVDKYKTFSLDDFYKWNPDVGTDCSGLTIDYYVCVGVTETPTSLPTTTASPTSDPSKPSPTQENVTKDCKAWYKVVSGDYCQKVVDKYGGAFSLADFYKWNPDVGTDCSGLPINTYVCVGVSSTSTTRPTTATTTTKPPSTVTGTNPPTPTQSGVSRSCNKWYYVSSGDYCYSISEQFHISLSDFFNWNTAVSTDCSNLPLNVYVCVGTQ